MLTSTPRRTLGYVRVSSDGQERYGTSLEGQQARIRTYCAAERHPEPQLYVEVESGGDRSLERRVELAALLRAAQPGDLVLVVRVDRWSRDLPYAVSSVRALVRRGVDWLAIDDGIDASTEQGDVALGGHAWMSDFERRRIESRTKGHRRALRALGFFVEGRPPFGYRRAGRTIVIVIEEAELIREAHRRAAAGATVRQLIAFFGGRRGTCGTYSVHRILRSRIYLGEIERSPGSGEWIAAHEAIIDRATWERTQEALQARRQCGRTPDSPRTASWLMRGLARCASCGSRVGAAYGKRRPSGDPTSYYLCGGRAEKRGCTAPYHRVDAVDPQLNALALTRLEELRHLLATAAAPAPVATPAPDLPAQRTRLEAQRERAIRLALSGTITDADLAVQLKRLEVQLGKLARAEDDARRAAAVVRPEARIAALAAVDVLRAAWERIGPTGRRDALRQLARSIRLGPEGLDVAWRSPEELAREHAEIP